MKEVPLDARLRRRAALLSWLANIALGALVGSCFLVHVPFRDLGWRGCAFAVLGLVSTIVTLTALPGMALVLLAGRCAARRWFAPLSAFVWTAFQILLYVDTRIFNLFRYHFNGQVWDLIYTRGSQDAVHLGWQVWTLIAGGVSVGCCFQAWLWKRCLLSARGPLDSRALRGLWLRPGLVFGLVLLPVMFAEKTIYAQADLARDRHLTTLSRIFPFYPRIPAMDLASSVWGDDEPPLPVFEPPDEQLRYPLAPPRIDARGPRPNVLIVAIDCWRRDQFSREATPRLFELAQSGWRRFDDHASGGNSTRFGLFSMLYGLHGSYWFPVLAERRPPVLIDTLQQLGYDCRVWASASANYPEMRATAWSGIEAEVHDAWPVDAVWRKDELAAQGLVGWLSAEGAQRTRPYFGFLFLDSPHQTYSHPPGATPFEPSADGINYLEIATLGRAPELLLSIFNRYRNAVHHADRVAADALEELERCGALDNTLVIVTGDHGEEFDEHGFYGHTSNFTPTQVAVPFLMRGPGIEPGLETRPTTHLDVACTLLEALGAERETRANWTLGRNLLDPAPDRRRVVAGWRELGLWTEDGILRVPLVDRPSFDVELYDYDWRLVADDRAGLRRQADALAQLAYECRRFLR